MSKKELVLRAIRGEKVERIPVGFWLHYVTQEEKELGLRIEGYSTNWRASSLD